MIIEIITKADNRQMPESFPGRRHVSWQKKLTFIINAIQSFLLYTTNIFCNKAFAICDYFL